MKNWYRDAKKTRLKLGFKKVKLKMSKDAALFNKILDHLDPSRLDNISIGMYTVKLNFSPFIIQHHEEEK